MTDSIAKLIDFHAAVLRLTVDKERQAVALRVFFEGRAEPMTIYLSDVALLKLIDASRCAAQDLQRLRQDLDGFLG